MSLSIYGNNTNNNIDNTTGNNHMVFDPVVKNSVNENNSSGVKQKKALGIDECETCKNRRYQDGSNDPGVSFKSPTKLSPSIAATAVYSHEREHFSRESAKAEREDREVLQNNITIFTAVCPECGKTYVSGGETRTVTRAKAEKANFAKQFFEDTVGKYMSQSVDQKV